MELLVPGKVPQICSVYCHYGVQNMQYDGDTEKELLKYNNRF